MKPRMRPRKPASIGSNQAPPANSPSGLAAVVLSLPMAWSPPARQRRALVVESQRRLRHPISNHISDGTSLSEYTSSPSHIIHNLVSGFSSELGIRQNQSS